MTGEKDMWWPFQPPSSGKKTLTPKMPSPAPTILDVQETEAARRRAGGRRRGRGATELAGRLMSRRGKIALGE